MSKLSISKRFMRGVVVGLVESRRKTGFRIQVRRVKQATGDSVDLKSIVRRVAGYQGAVIGFFLPHALQQMAFDHALNKVLAHKRLESFLKAVSIRFSKGNRA